jgi:hypothetical protein
VARSRKPQAPKRPHLGKKKVEERRKQIHLRIEKLKRRGTWVE